MHRTYSNTRSLQVEVAEERRPEYVQSLSMTLCRTISRTRQQRLNKQAYEVLATDTRNVKCRGVTSEVTDPKKSQDLPLVYKTEVEADSSVRCV